MESKVRKLCMTQGLTLGVNEWSHFRVLSMELYVHQDFTLGVKGLRPVDGFIAHLVERRAGDAKFIPLKPNSFSAEYCE